MSNVAGTACPSNVRTGRGAPAKNLVFGLVDKGVVEGSNLVFVKEKKAKRLASVHIAIGTAKTWGTFRRKMPAEDLRYVVDRLQEREEPLPRKRDKFGFGLLPSAYFDGDWPGWPEQMMLDWMPEEIVEKYGQAPCSVLNGHYLVLRMSDAEEILKALERDGFRCRLDEKLVRQACGRSSSSETTL
jgi:hypothetical protein